MRRIPLFVAILTTTNLTTTFSTEELASLPTAMVGLGVINTSLLSPGVA
jgi:hypothetical protein